MDEIEEIDVGQFIMEIEKRPSIWDLRSEDYKDRHKKNAAWYEICFLLNLNFAKQSKPKRKLICRKMQQKWRNIRDYHRKYMNKFKKSGCGSTKKFKYVYDDKLAFLTPLLGINGRARKQDDQNPCMVEPDGFTTDESSNEPVSLNAPETPAQSPVFSTTKAEKVISKCKKKKKRKKRSELQEKVCKFFDNISMPLFEEDEDKSFLDSLLPTLRNFDTDQKLDFRVEVLRIVQRIRQSKSLELMQSPLVDGDHPGEFLIVHKQEM